MPLQRRAGRVKDGPYANIVVNPRRTQVTVSFIMMNE